MAKGILYRLLFYLFSVDENLSRDLGQPRRILIIRQHNQLGDLLASVSLFRALKQSFPAAHITVVVSPQNALAVEKNKFIDRIVLFDKHKIAGPGYLLKFIKILREPYDVVIVPPTVSISFTSNFMARISNSKIRIGVSELNGETNPYSFFFDRRVVMDWRKHPDSNVSDFCLDILREFSVSTSDFSSEISFDKSDENLASQFIKSLGHNGKTLLIGLHVGAGKPPNRWSLDKYIDLIKRINNNYKAVFYLTGSRADKQELEYMQQNLGINTGLFADKTIPQVAALISRSALFITNDTGIMHVAGATKTAQISIFGPTNPYNWAPVGSNKYFLRKSDLIDDITVDDVYEVCDKILSASAPVSN